MAVVAKTRLGEFIVEDDDDCSDEDDDGGGRREEGERQRARTKLNPLHVTGGVNSGDVYLCAGQELVVCWHPWKSRGKSLSFPFLLFYLFCFGT